MPAPGGYASNHTTYYSAQSTPPAPAHQERSYTLGGDGYGANSVPPLPEHDNSYFPSQGSVPTSINTNTGYVMPPQTSPVKGPRAQNQLSVRNDMDESPPVYDAGTSNVQGAWGKH